MDRLPLVAPLAVLYLALLALEQRLPLRRRSRPLAGRLKLNLALSAIALGTGAVVVAPAVSAGLVLGAERELGLLRLLSVPPWLQLPLAFLLLDLTFYYWHVANHRIPFLWRFHNVHHIDPDLDVTTGLRFHFAEVGLSSVFRGAQIVLLGIPAGALVLYEACFQASTFFHHSNVRLPIGLERALNRVLVTPRMHGIHHSRVRQETDSNYSVVFCWWDRIHRTLRRNVAQDALTIGVPGYAQPEDNRLRDALLHPFRPQRRYWPLESPERAGSSGPPQRPLAE